MAASTSQPILHIFENDKDVADKACQFVIDTANKAIDKHGIFVIGLSGGSAAKYLCNGLPSLQTDWTKWRVFFCDERHVLLDDPECTYTIYKNGLMSKVPLGEEQVFPDDPSLTVEAAAERYAEKLRQVCGEELPRFDLMVLGMGPDGHTCSLFPGHPLLQEEKAWVSPISDSPKPPPKRITMTYPVIQNCVCAMFISCGQGKAQMVQRVIDGKEEPLLPAARVRPHSGTVCWFLDKPAASLLQAAQL